MRQFPLFANLAGRTVILLGSGEAADAKRRLYERAGAVISDNPNAEGAALGIVAHEDDELAALDAARLKRRGLLVNVVDRPELCDFTTPAIVDRDPVTVAIGTAGASAGLAKALRQRIEALLAPQLGTLASDLFAARNAIRARWPQPADRRRAIDAALAEGGPLDPGGTGAFDVSAWLTGEETRIESGLHIFDLMSDDPDDLTLRAARLLGQADRVYHDAAVPAVILERARADAERIAGAPPEDLPEGLSLHLRRR
ncbi:precorrin-2 dehydrogenase/sirohydrochlorin ferrochelatase family protein [Novosphingopyxis iocasae]|uniref:precorrin-2 dehydrogenase/sirohydrochlorin ferrochelatase family protein n=1 Tax=Novosphingopyxis iocasae TaxID=2762729 RepID=UPI001650FA01|nr:bifunctional precorrin-2 dehydrogenase/sirohydrochlorin ferrochelatase [Novosphingopyxis iocasae]